MKKEENGTSGFGSLTRGDFKNQAIDFEGLAVSFRLYLQKFPFCWRKSWSDPEDGGEGVQPSLPGKSQNIGILSNTGPDRLKIHKATKLAFNVGLSRLAFCWRADDVPLLVVHVFRSPLPHHLKNVFRVGPSLAKLSGLAHESNRMWNLNINYDLNQE